MGLFSAPTSFPKSFQPWKNKFPTLEILFSSLGNLIFHRWKVQFPPLETLGPPYETCPLPEKSTQLGRCY